MGEGVKHVQKRLDEEARKWEEEHWTTLAKAISKKPVKACRK